jgi:hypothetical protein
MIDEDGTGDPYLHLRTTSAQDWTVGIDNSDSDKFMISSHADPGTNARLVIDTSGNVGIGTTLPDQRLTVAHASGGYITLRRDEADIRAGEVLGVVYFGATENSGTNVGIGAAIKAYCTDTLFVEGDKEGTELRFYTTVDDAQALSLRLTIKEDGDFVGSSSADISDERLKTNITGLTGSLNKINQLRGVSFTWKPEANKSTDTTYLGLLAQEVESHFPDVVRNESISDVKAEDAVEAKEAVLDEDGNVVEEAVEAQDAIEGVYYKSLHYTGLIAPMIQAIQELSAKVTALENA